MEPLFPELPEDLSSLSDDELAGLLREHEVTAEAVEAEDEELLKGLSADEVLEAQTQGVEQIEAIVAEQKARKDREAEYLARKEELAARRAALASEPEEGEGDGEGDGEGEGEGAAELAAEAS